MSPDTPSKLTLFDERVKIPRREAAGALTAILLSNGCPEDVAQTAQHLVEADLSGVESHGVMRSCNTSSNIKAVTWMSMPNPPSLNTTALPK